MRSRPNTVFLHFAGSLTAFFSTEDGEVAKQVDFQLHPAAKDLIESQGVPHVEVFALRVNGQYEPLEYNVEDGDRLEVLPKSCAIGLKPSEAVRNVDDMPAKFAADVHLGKLTRLLRLVGIDTAYSNKMDDPEIVELAVDEDRAVLSRDLGLLKHGALTYGYWLRSDDPDRQVLEVIDYFDLKPTLSPFTRCLQCNGRLQHTELKDVEERVPEKVKQWNNKYQICMNCKKVYWQGSHYEELKKKVNRILRAVWR